MFYTMKFCLFSKGSKEPDEYGKKGDCEEASLQRVPSTSGDISYIMILKLYDLSTRFCRRND